MSAPRCSVQAAAMGVWVLASMCAPRTAQAHAQATTTVQFEREIVRILDNHCVMCHTEGGPTFPLVTYEQTYAARWKIRQSVLNRHMSPWAAVPGYGEFINDNSLTQREIDFLVSWAESYGPRNNGAVYTGVALQTPSKPVQARTDFDRWVLGKPDLTMPVTETSQQIIIDPKLKADRWLRGFEYQPGDRRGVHSVSFSIQETGQWIGSWTPWYGYMSLPDGLGIRLPAKSHIAAQIQYQAGMAAPSKGTLGLYFAASAPGRGVSNLALGAQSLRLTSDLNVLAIQPILSPEVKSIQVIARIPNAATQVLLFARDIRLEWPTPYVLRQPVFLPKGTELMARGAPATLSVFEGAEMATSQAKPDKGMDVRRFELKGAIKSIDAENGLVVVDHAAIPGLMGAMTMSYRVDSRESLKNLAAGDEIRSDVVVSDTGSHLENIQVTRRKQ